MKRLIIIAVFGVLSFTIQGQQMSQYTNFVTNYFAFNPAMAGSAACLNLNMGYRKQWQGFDGAPTTAFANLHGNFGKKGKNFHGIGGLVETDDTGPLSFTTMHLAYAYHMQMSSRVMMSMGVAAGFAQYRVDFGGMNLANFDDPAINAAESNFILPQVRAGVWIYGPDRFIGFSVRNIVVNKLPFASGEAKFRRHFELMAGKIVELGDDFLLKPAAQIKYVGSSRPSLDFQAMMDYKDKLSVGLGFRSENGLSALLKIDMFKYVSLAYAYDITLSKVRLSGLNTHEIMIGIQACPQGERKYIPCGAYN